MDPKPQFKSFEELITEILSHLQKTSCTASYNYVKLVQFQLAVCKVTLFKYKSGADLGFLKKRGGFSKKIKHFVDLFLDQLNYFSEFSLSTKRPFFGQILESLRGGVKTLRIRGIRKIFSGTKREYIPLRISGSKRKDRFLKGKNRFHNVFEYFVDNFF